MKRYAIICFILILLFFCSCGNRNVPKDHYSAELNADEETKIDISVQDLSAEAIESGVVSIEDQTVGKRMDLPQEEEIFFEDEHHRYRFHPVMSRYVIVTYEDGRTESVSDALWNGRIKIRDLDTFGIRYSVEEKDTSADGLTIIDETKTREIALAEAIEVFYEDDEYEYLFSCIKSHYVTVIYPDGNQENVAEALAAGRIRITDLDRFEIEYFTEEKHRNPNLLSIEDQSVAEITKNTPELFYEDESFRYYLPEGLADQILVTYTDGTSEPVEAALVSGRISTLDLDQFEISYTRIEKYMAVMQRDGKEEFPLPDEARQTVEEILSGQEWIDTVPNCLSDIILSTGVGYLEYHTDCGTFTYLPDMTCCTVSEEERLQLLELFSSVIPIP